MFHQANQIPATGDAAGDLPTSGRAALRSLAAMSNDQIETACEVLALAEKAGVCLWLAARDAGDTARQPRLLRAIDAVDRGADDLRRLHRAACAHRRPSLF